MSPTFSCSPSATMFSVVVMPVARPDVVRMWASSRTVVVLPFDPVTAATGIRPSEPGPKRWSRTAPPTFRPRPDGRSGVHPEARPGVDLDDRPARLVQAAADVRRDDVDPRDIEPDDAGGQLGHGGDGSGGPRRCGRCSCHRSRGWRHAASATRRPASGTDRPSSSPAPSGGRWARVVDADPGELQGVPVAAPGVGVLALDQLADRLPAVADDARGHPLRAGDQATADDEQAMVSPLDLALDDRLPAPAGQDRELEGCPGVRFVVAMSRLTPRP